MDGFRSKTTEIRNELANACLIAGIKRPRLVLYLALFLFGSFVAWFGMQFQGTPETVTPLAHARMLAADTWNHGCVARPEQPGGLFLQTYQTLQFPNYVAAIQPGEAVMPAVGMRLGDPLWGLSLQCGLFTLAMAWMIRGFASMRWALIGALFSAVWFGALSYWGQSFDGWMATGIGVAMAWGALRRYAGNRRVRYCLALSLGAGWAFLCAPLAALFALPVPLYLWTKIYSKQGRRIELIALLLPLIATAALQIAYNKATTNEYLKSPFQAYREKYNNHPLFIWQPPSIPPDFDFVRMEQYDLKVNQVASRLAPPVAKVWAGRLTDSLSFYAGLPICVLLVGAIWSGVSKWGKRLLAGAAVSLSSTIIILPYDPGYAASLACLAPLLGVWAMRSLWARLENHGTNCWRLSGWLLAAVLIATHVRGLGREPYPDLEKHAKYQKEITEHLLKTEAGKHLVLVNYNVDVPPRVEYVYNTSSPDTQDIVWARWNTELNAKDFFAHHKGRALWLLQVTSDQLPALRRMDWQSSDSKIQETPEHTPEASAPKPTTDQ